MSASTLSRLQRRHLNTAADEADKMVRADERYFARFPDRSHRVRLASRSEMQANFLAYGINPKPPAPGCRWFAIVKQIEAGVRSRVFVENDAEADCDMGEAEAKQVYDHVAHPGTRAHQLEQQLRSALAKRAAH